MPPDPGELVSLEFGGSLKFSVGATAGYEIKGTHSVAVRDLALSEHYALSVIGKLTFSGGVSGRFGVDVTAGTTPEWARVVVRRRREKEIQVAADATVKADLRTEGLPSSGKEFLGALLGLEAKNWLNLVDRLVSEAGEVDSVETLKAKLDGLARHYVSAFAGKAIDQLTRVPEVKAFQERLGRVVHSYRTLDAQAIALFDRYFDPILDRTKELRARLDELQAMTSWDQLKGEVDPLLWNVVRQLTGGDPLGWALGRIPGTPVPSLPELKKRIADTVALLQDDAHAEIRAFVKLAKEQFGLDPLFNQLAAVSTPEGLKALAGTKLGDLVQRLIGDAVDKINGNALKKAFQAVHEIVTARDKFFKKFDEILGEAAAQRFTLGLHAAYRAASASDALIDLEIRLREDDGQPCIAGQRLMEAAGRGEFSDALANYQPAVVRLREGLLTHSLTSQTTVGFNVAGWHRAFSYQGVHRVVVATKQQMKDGGRGLVTVFTTVDMQAESERRSKGSRGEEVVQTNFLLRVLAEGALADAKFDTRTRQYALDVVTGMTASYGVTFTDADTSLSELDDYLAFATAAGARRGRRHQGGAVAGASRRARQRRKDLVDLRCPVHGGRGARSVDGADATGSHPGRPPKAGALGLLRTAAPARRRLALRQRRRPGAVRRHGPMFTTTESVLRNASVGCSRPFQASIRPRASSRRRWCAPSSPPCSASRTTSFGRSSALTSLLRSTTPIPAADLESRLKAFGDVLQQFDRFDLAENSVFAVFDGLLHSGRRGAARASSLSFTAVDDGAERTKVFTLTAPPGADA